MDCRNPAMLRAEQLEELVWNQVKGMVQNPELIVAGIESLGAQEDGGLAEQTRLGGARPPKGTGRGGESHPIVRVG